MGRMSTPDSAPALGGVGEGPTGRSWGQLLWDTSPVVPPLSFPPFPPSSLSPPPCSCLCHSQERAGQGSHGSSTNLDSSPCGQVGAFWEQAQDEGTGFRGEEVEVQRSPGGGVWGREPEGLWGVNAVSGGRSREMGLGTGLREVGGWEL